MNISVIIVNWNTKDILLKCLDSIRNDLKGEAHEIIVVDNGSSDGSVEAVRNAYPDIRLVTNPENLGFAKANNIGVKICRGKYVCLVNSDIIIPGGCFDIMSRYMDENPDIGILGPKVLNMEDNSWRWSCKRFPTLWSSFSDAIGLTDRMKCLAGEFVSDVPCDKPTSVEVLAGVFWMIRREALERVGLLDERFFIYAEDKDYCKRMRESGWKVAFFPHAHILHYGGASSSSDPVRFYLEQHKANIKYWKKHHPGIGTGIYLLLVSLKQIKKVAVGSLYFIIKPYRKKQSMDTIKGGMRVMSYLIRGE